MKSLSYLAAAVGLSAVVQCAHAQSVQQPVFKEGDFWEYQMFDSWSNRMTSTFSKQVIGISGDFIRVSYDLREISKTGDISRPQQNEATLRADLNATSMSGGEKYEKLYYKWPLEPGKKWIAQFKGDLAPATANAAAQVIATTLNVEVKGWEKLTTPAGDFNTLKIIAKGNWVTSNSTQANGTGTFTATRWYSPDARSDVQYTYEAFGADGAPLTKTRQVLSSVNLK
jgi:hypothetical protein